MKRASHFATSANPARAAPAADAGRRTLLLGLPLAALWAGCGQGGDDGSPTADGGMPGGPAPALSGQEVARIPAVEVKAWGEPIDLTPDYSGWNNPLPPYGDWEAPDGAPSGVIVDPATDGLRVPAGASPIGLRRYTGGPVLFEGRSYELSLLDASTADLRLTLTLEDRYPPHEPLPLASTGPIEARPGSAALFTPPATTERYGFRYDIGDPAGAGFRIQLRGQVPAGEDLLGVTGQDWYTWSGGVQPDVTYDMRYQWTTIRAPGGDVSITQAVKRFDAVPLIEPGTTLELRLAADQLGAGAALFFFDAQYQPIAVNGGNWVYVQASTASAGDDASASRFVWPANVAYFVLQVQGPWQATSACRVWPTVVEVADAG